MQFPDHVVIAEGLTVGRADQTWQPDAVVSHDPCVFVSKSIELGSAEMAGLITKTRQSVDTAMAPNVLNKADIKIFDGSKNPEVIRCHLHRLLWNDIFVASATFNVLACRTLRLLFETKIH